jgi:hypothetical protein
MLEQFTSRIKAMDLKLNYFALFIFLIIQTLLKLEFLVQYSKTT